MIREDQEDHALLRRSHIRWPCHILFAWWLVVFVVLVFVSASNKADENRMWWGLMCMRAIRAHVHRWLICERLHTVKDVHLSGVGLCCSGRCAMSYRSACPEEDDAFCGCLRGKRASVEQFGIIMKTEEEQEPIVMCETVQTELHVTHWIKSVFTQHTWPNTHKKMLKYLDVEIMSPHVDLVREW